MFSQNVSLAVYPTETQWKQLIQEDIEVAQVIENSKDYINGTCKFDMLSDLEILKNAIHNKIYNAMTLPRCEAIAKYKLISPYLYMIFDYDSWRLQTLMENSHEEEVIREIVCKIVNSPEQLSGSKYVKNMVYSICVLNSSMEKTKYIC